MTSKQPNLSQYENIGVHAPIQHPVSLDTNFIQAVNLQYRLIVKDQYLRGYYEDRIAPFQKLEFDFSNIKHFLPNEGSQQKDLIDYLNLQLNIAAHESLIIGGIDGDGFDKFNFELDFDESETDFVDNLDEESFFEGGRFSPSNDSARVESLINCIKNKDFEDVVHPEFTATMLVDGVRQWFNVSGNEITQTESFHEEPKGVIGRPRRLFVLDETICDAFTDSVYPQALESRVFFGLEWDSGFVIENGEICDVTVYMRAGLVDKDRRLALNKNTEEKINALIKDARANNETPESFDDQLWDVICEHKLNWALGAQVLDANKLYQDWSFYDDSFELNDASVNTIIEAQKDLYFAEYYSKATINKGEPDSALTSRIKNHHKHTNNVIKVKPGDLTFFDEVGDYIEHSHVEIDGQKYEHINLLTALASASEALGVSRYGESSDLGDVVFDLDDVFDDYHNRKELINYLDKIGVSFINDMKNTYLVLRCYDFHVARFAITSKQYVTLSDRKHFTAWYATNVAALAWDYQHGNASGKGVCEMLRDLLR